ncbi:MAG: hypothetical protein ACR2JQ_08615, partial [Mycobacteriales bacterium]
ETTGGRTGRIGRFCPAGGIANRLFHDALPAWLPPACDAADRAFVAAVPAVTAPTNDVVTSAARDDPVRSVRSVTVRFGDHLVGDNAP